MQTFNIERVEKIPNQIAGNFCVRFIPVTTVTLKSHIDSSKMLINIKHILSSSLSVATSLAMSSYHSGT